jgi:hypothetical protein
MTVMGATRVNLEEWVVWVVWGMEPLLQKAANIASSLPTKRDMDHVIQVPWPYCDGVQPLQVEVVYSDASMIRACAVAAAGVVAPAACLQEYEQVQGERVLYEYSEGLHPCAGTARYVDGLVPFLEQQLAVEAPELLRFSWIAKSDEWSPLGVAAGAQIAAGQHAWSGSPVNIHELTHAVTGSMPARFFMEGVADAVDSIGDDLAPRYPVSDEDLARPIWEPRATMTAMASGDVNYATAASFVTYLLVRHGPEHFAAFYRGLGGPATMPWLRDRFRQAYGLELDDEIDAFRAGIPACGADVHPLPLPECSGPGVGWDSEWLWEHKVSMACDDPGVVGGIDPDYVWPSFQAITLEVPVQGYYVLSLDNLDVSARFGPCFGCPWEPKDVFLELEMSQRMMLLDPGTYYLRVNSRSDESPEVTVRLQRQ